MSKLILATNETINIEDGAYLGSFQIITDDPLSLWKKFTDEALVSISLTNDDSDEVFATYKNCTCGDSISVTKSGDSYLATYPIRQKTETEILQDTIDELGEIKKETVQSDKIGYDWIIYYVNDVVVKKTYVEQETPFGTTDNPIVWKEGMSLIQNAYYTYNDVRKVWMGDEGATAAWDDENFVEF